MDSGKTNYDSQQPASGSTRLLVVAVVYCVLVLVGAGLVALITLADVDWFYPTIAYGISVYVAWNWFALPSPRANLVRSSERTYTPMK